MWWSGNLNPAMHKRIIADYHGSKKTAKLYRQIRGGSHTGDGHSIPAPSGYGFCPYAFTRKLSPNERNPDLIGLIARPTAAVRLPLCCHLAIMLRTMQARGCRTSLASQTAAIAGLPCLSRSFERARAALSTSRQAAVRSPGSAGVVARILSAWEISFLSVRISV